MKARGSALIIAMLLITAIGGIAFAIGRLLFIESASASYYANGAVAYYAAESGMEEGFLRYRYNMNAEVPFKSWTLLENDKIYRTNIQQGRTLTGTGWAGITRSDALDKEHWTNASMEQIYDLRIGYIGTKSNKAPVAIWPFYGNDTTGYEGLTYSDFYSSYPDTINLNYAAGYYSPLRLNADESIKIDLSKFDLRNNEVNFMVAPVDRANILENSVLCQAAVEFDLILINAFGTSEHKSLLVPYKFCANSYPKLNADPNKVIVSTFQAPGSFTYSDVITQLINTTGGTTAGITSAVLKIKPLIKDEYIGLYSGNCSSCDNSSNVIPGPYTRIESTGYFGGTTRKLEANIDRQSGTLYDLFDYVIYKAS